MKAPRHHIIIITILYLLIVNCSLLFGIDLSLSPSGFVFFPSGAGNLTSNGIERYNMGGGGNIGFEFDIASVLPNPLGIGYTAGIEAGFHSSPFAHGDGQLNFYTFGGTIGVYYFPISRLPVRVDMGMGVYSANDGEEKTPSNFWFRFGGETGFRFTPNITLTAGVGWRQFQGASYPLASGTYVTAGLRFTFEAGERSSGGVSASISQYDGVYPVLSSLYQQSPIGSITIRNNENAEIRNVRVFFRAENYTSAEYPCGEAAIIPKGKSMEFPLYAEFSQEILRIAASGRILGDIVIRYTFLGKDINTARTVNIVVHNRNTLVPGDNSALASFVSASSYEVLLFSKSAANLARANHRLGLNSNMEMGIWLFESIRQSVKIEDRTEARTQEQTEEQTESADALPELQFPAQTLANGSGTLLEIALLYAASLQAAGVSAAIIVMPSGEVLCAASLGVKANSATAEALFNGQGKLLIADNEVWLPAAMSRLGEGFSAAWNEAVRRMDSLTANNENAEMIIIDEAWRSYPPAPFPTLGIHLVMPDSAAVNTPANAAMQSYIRSEFQPKITALQEQIRRNPSAALYNQLGNLYLRSGMMAQAKSTFEQAAGMGSTGAMVNRGNVALNENDIVAAERWFRQALARDSQNKSALRGLEYVEARK